MLPVAFQEDWVQSPEVVPRQGLHHSNGDGGASVNSMTGDLPNTVGDVLQTSGDGIAPSIFRFYGGGCYNEEGLR
jgi:hypothetical protein